MADHPRRMSREYVTTGGGGGSWHRGGSGASSSSADGYSGRTGEGSWTRPGRSVGGAVLECVFLEVVRTGTVGGRPPIGSPATTPCGAIRHPRTTRRGGFETPEAALRWDPSRSRYRHSTRGVSGRRMAPQGLFGGPPRSGQTVAHARHRYPEQGNPDRRPLRCAPATSATPRPNDHRIRRPEAPRGRRGSSALRTQPQLEQPPCRRAKRKTGNDQGPILEQSERPNGDTAERGYASSGNDATYAAASSDSGNAISRGSRSTRPWSRPWQ